MFANVRGMKRIVPSTVTSVLALTALTACGGSVPAVGPDRESGQSKLMDKTFAGANKCNPKNHDRPFIIEWDATDMSQFESLSASDVVFAKYDGCELQIVDACKNDSLKGSLGAYKPVEWTSGSVEKININNEGELYAKLPLGVASLGARVSAGESFLMEYFVAGTRSATRPSAYKADLAKIPGCKGVTHFVYAYNLGAFALGSTKNIQGEAGVSVWGAGAGGNSKYASAAEKKGGQLASCRGESAKEVASCKTPIRLTLREIEDGENPDVKSAVAPEMPSALNLAGKVDAKMKLNEKAQEHFASANEKAVARDGKGCLAELDEKDKADSRPIVVSTNPKNYYAEVRARCLMLAGQCNAGKVLERKWLEGTATTQLGPEVMDRHVDAIAAQNCQGGAMSPRDQLLAALTKLQYGANLSKTEASVCHQSYDTVVKLRTSVKPRDDDDHQVKNASQDLHIVGAQCLGRAEDCTAAWELYRGPEMAHLKERAPNAAGQVNEQSTRKAFAMHVPKCKTP
jgi:hypothetical protein